MGEQFYWWSLGNLTFLGSGYRAWEFLFNSLEIWHKCRSLIVYKEDYSWTHGVMVLVLTRHSMDPLGGTTGCQSWSVLVWWCNLLIDRSFHIQCWLFSTFFFCHPFEGHWSYGLYCQIGKKNFVWFEHEMHPICFGCGSILPVQSVCILHWIHLSLGLYHVDFPFKLKKSLRFLRTAALKKYGLPLARSPAPAWKVRCTLLQQPMRGCIPSLQLWMTAVGPFDFFILLLLLFWKDKCVYFRTESTMNRRIRVSSSPLALPKWEQPEKSYPKVTDKSGPKTKKPTSQAS